MKLLSHRRMLARGVVAAAAAVALTGAVGAGSALASPTPIPIAANGTTTITLGGPAIQKLTQNGCGTLYVSNTLNVSASLTGKNTLKLIFPITGLETTGPNFAVRLDHAGSVTFENTCYAVTLGTLRISNFGNADQDTTLDLSAVTKTNGTGIGRQVVGELDLSSAQFSIGGNKVRVEQMNLLTAPEGTLLLNNLATGSDMGPFSDGMKIASAKSKVVFAF